MAKPDFCKYLSEGKCTYRRTQVEKAQQNPNPDPTIQRLNTSLSTYPEPSLLSIRSGGDFCVFPKNPTEQQNCTFYMRRPQ